jgi:membrane protease subunit (stomatin/prohibitin family)/predicted RNA-binding Zn-ribbon protein involved in translation (DUF1610 family)
MASVACPHCGNVVVYDQGKKKPVCPVCNQEILPATGQKLVAFKCPECGVSLQASNVGQEYTCPICDCHIDVQHEVAKAKYSGEGLVSKIEYMGDNNTFVYKHPIENFAMGSQLIVHESQEAVFYRDGQALDLFGPGRHTLDTQYLPLMDKVYKLPTGDTRGTFRSEVYYINMATQIGIKWGTDTKVRVFDPYSGMHVSIGASGEFNIRVSDSRKILLKLVGTTSGLIMHPKEQQENYHSSPVAMTKYFRSLIMTKVKSYLATVIKQEEISVLEIDSRLDTLSEAMRDQINEGLREYGLTMPQFYIMRMLTPEDDPDDPAHEQYIEMKKQFGSVYLDVQEEKNRKKTAEAARERMQVEAETEAQMKIIGAQGDAQRRIIEAQAKAAEYKMQAEAEAAEMQMKGYTYQQQTAKEIGLEAMKNGITGGSGSSGAVGEMASLGVTLGTMGGVMNMVRDAVNPIGQTAGEIGSMISDGIADKWDCQCGMKGITSKFCPNCGKPRPVQKPVDMWNCKCGTKGIHSKFCPNCGTVKPENPKPWDCSCGMKGITSKFCPNCGSAKPISDIWKCEVCGTDGLTSAFCPVCGNKRKGEA